MIFISHRISDSLDLVSRLDADLAHVFGTAAVFRDRTRLFGGHDWTQMLENEARLCSVMLVVIGPTWQSATLTDGDWKGAPRLWNPDDWVRKEIILALDAGNVVIPIFLNDAPRPTEGWLRMCSLDRLYKKQGAPIHSTDYEADFKKLVTVLRVHLSKIADETLDKMPFASSKILVQSDTKTSAVLTSGKCAESIEQYSPVLPSWPEPVGSFELAVSHEAREQIIGLTELCASKMQSLRFPGEAIRAFQVAFAEAIANGFEHGCGVEQDLVTFRIEIWKEYSSFAVINPKGRPFNLQHILQESISRLSQNPRSRRGRGMLLIRDLSDRLCSVEGNLGIKAVFERERVAFSVIHVEDVTIITLEEGIRNHSLQRRTLTLVEAESKRNIILDFSTWKTGGTLLYTVVLDAELILSRSKKRLVALLFAPTKDDCSPIQLPDELIAFDVSTALTKINRQDLQSKVSAQIAVENREERWA